MSGQVQKSAGIDLHTHLAPALDQPVRGVSREGDRLIVDGHRVGTQGLYRPDQLCSHLHAVGLSEAVVSMPPPFFRQHLEARAARAWAKVANDGLARVTDAHPELRRLAYLPLEHPLVARAEYDRVRVDDAWAGVVASAGGGSGSLADPALEPLWRALDDDGRLVMLHPGASPDRRLDELYLANLLGNPVETAIAAAQLVLGRVLTRWPRIRFLLVHCGGCVPSLVGRWERGVLTERPGLVALDESPREAVRRFFVDCLAHDPRVVDLATATFGEDKIVLGSDWPFPMGVEDPRALVAHRGAEFCERVAQANALAALARVDGS